MGGSVALAVVFGLTIRSLIDPDSAPTAGQVVAELDGGRGRLASGFHGGRVS